MAKRARLDAGSVSDGKSVLVLALANEEWSNYYIMPLNDLTDEHWAFLHRLADGTAQDPTYSNTHWRGMVWSELTWFCKYVFCGEDCEYVTLEHVLPARIVSTEWSKRGRLSLPAGSVLFHCALRV